MLTRIYNSYLNFLDNDLVSSKVLFLLVGISFLAFANFAANVPLSGPIDHKALNYIPSLTSFFFLVVLSFTQWGVKHRQTLLTIFIYEFNFINLYLLYATKHMDMYAYQFIVGYVVSSYFFHTKRGLRTFALTVNIGLFFTLFTSHDNTKSPIDFYMTYAVSQGIFAVLYRYRFSIEERLTESEKKYRLLAENSFDLICIHDVKGKMEFVSPSSKRLLGFAPEEMVGIYPASMVHADDKKVMMAVDLTDPAHPFMDKPIQFRLRNAKGEYIWFECVFTLMDGSDGRSNFVLSQSRDIRRSKKYQSELEERSRELERSNADLETFAFVSSHDLQEPLRMISNYTQLLKKRYADKLDADANEFIDFANNGAKNLQQLLRDLLSYSRITRAEIKKVPLSMNSIMDEVLKNIHLELESRNAKVNYKGLCNISADKNMIMLVMQNLVLNGIKYNTSPNPEVNINCVLDQKEVIFSIADNGIGIDKLHQQRIFEPFQRIHTKATYPGTGLGLSICKKIIERFGGKLWVESETDKGSRFFFYLPLE